MTDKIAAFLRGVFSSLLLITNTFFWFVPILFLAIIRLLLPFGAVQKRVARALVWCAEQWVTINGLMLDLFLRIEWDIRGLEGLDRDEWYLVVSNHQSWVDIPVLQYAFDGRIPFLKFFIKKQLIWVPMLGLAWWALDMPFMQRHTREQLAARPELKGQDLETTRRACEKFAQQPTSIINFLEGTRFTPEKHRHRNSPFRQLLPPRAGGIAFAISALGERFHYLLDATIAYPGGVEPSFWALLSGRIRRVAVHIRRLDIPEQLLSGDYLDDPDYRARFQSWVTGLWQEKDRRLVEMLA